MGQRGREDALDGQAVEVQGRPVAYTDAHVDGTRDVDVLQRDLGVPHPHGQACLARDPRRVQDLAVDQGDVAVVEDLQRDTGRPLHRQASSLEAAALHPHAELVPPVAAGRGTDDDVLQHCLRVDQLDAYEVVAGQDHVGELQAPTADLDGVTAALADLQPGEVQGAAPPSTLKVTGGTSSIGPVPPPELPGSWRVTSAEQRPAKVRSRSVRASFSL